MGDRSRDKGSDDDPDLTKYIAKAATILPMLSI
jgi:hypothetical protein